MAISVYDTGFFPKSYLNYLQQRRVGTGMPVRPEDEQAIAEADINARYADASKRRAMGIQEKAIDYGMIQSREANAAKMRMMDKANTTATQNSIIGLGASLPIAGIQGYNLYKQMFPDTTITDDGVTVVNGGYSLPRPPTEASSLSYVPSNATDYAPGIGDSGIPYEAYDAVDYVPGVGETGVEAGGTVSTSSAAAPSAWTSWMPAIGGAFRAGTGLAMGEKPVKAVTHGATTAFGAWGGAAAGTAIFPGVGTVIGGIIGAIGGNFLGDLFDDWF